MIGADKGDGKTLGPKSARATHSVQIGICITWKVIVDCKIDTLDIDSSTEDIGSNADALVELLELLIAFDATDIRLDSTCFELPSHVPLFLAHTGMHSNAREIALPEQLVQFCSPNGALYENDDLIKLQRIKQITELPILFPFAQFDVVLLKTVKCKLGLIINVNLERILHEFLANRTNFL